MCHRLAVAIFDTSDDPISPFEEHNFSLLDSALNLPRQTFNSQELYPAFVEKAAILYYTLNKNHSFQNGNKRIATASLLVFCYINNFWLNASVDEMVQKALYVANSKSSLSQEILKDVQEWIRRHLVEA